MRLILLAVLVAASSSPALSAGDAAEGQHLASQWCSSCHGASDAVPTLETLVNRPGRTPDTLQAWLTAPHPPMPNFSLSREQIDDLVAYLASLAKPR